MKSAIFSSLFLAMISVAHAGTLSTIVRDTSLYQRPSTLSGVVKPLAAGDQVEALQRSGGWKKIQSNGVSGWVRSYHVRNGSVVSTGQSAPAKSSGGFIDGLAGLSRRASSLFTVKKDNKPVYHRTATIGVRGLSEEQIKNARPDYAQLERMERQRSNPSTAANFARQGRLTARTLGHMPQSGRER